MLILGLAVLVAALLCLFVALGLTDRPKHDEDDESSFVAGTAGETPRTTLIANSDLGWGRYVVPPFLVERAERNLVLAGRPPAWPLRRILTAKIVMTGVGVLVALMFFSSGISAMKLLMGVVVIAISYVVPDVLLHGRAVERQARIEQQLPDLLDQTTISIESGMSFEGALASVGAKTSGPLSDELIRTVQDMRLGMSRRDAYAALAERCTSDDLRKFTKSIVQAEGFGVSITSVVRNQAKELRHKRRMTAEGKALQVPVKMLFPLLVCLLPVLFIVVLAPAFINIANTLGQ